MKNSLKSMYSFYVAVVILGAGLMFNITHDHVDLIINSLWLSALFMAIGAQIYYLVKANREENTDE